VTSDGDVMATSVERLRGLLVDAHIPVKFSKLSGPHDYIFNQGPGAISLLIFHNDVLSERNSDLSHKDQ